jgi:CheY-like chemotaxis protein
MSSDAIKILLVDDEDAYAQAMRDVLDSYGLEVRAASNAVEALAILGDWTPDAILLDIMMPEVDGVMLMRLLRTAPDWPGVPIIVVSAKATPEERKEIIASGADAFLAKPFTAQELRAVIRRFVGLPQTSELIARQ